MKISLALILDYAKKYWYFLIPTFLFVIYWFFFKNKKKRKF